MQIQAIASISFALASASRYLSGGCGLIDSVVGCGFAMGGGLGGDWRWLCGVGWLFLLREERHTQRKREKEMSHGE